MATVSNPSSSSSKLLPLLSRIGEAIGNTFVRLSKCSVYAREIEFLSELSDEQLAQRGLKREDIVRHVFRGREFI